MEDNAEGSEISRNVKVSEFIKKINSATPQGTPETQRRFHARWVGVRACMQATKHKQMKTLPVLGKRTVWKFPGR